MQIKREYPPNFAELSKRFRLRYDVIYTYGDTLYNPSGGDINGPLITHEETHSRQQLAMGVEEWWKKYIEDVDFRLAQELEAYRNQIEAFNKNKKDLAKREVFIRAIASDLSSAIYGNVISFDEALSKLRV